MKTLTLYTKPLPANQRQGLLHGRLISSKKWRDTKLALQQEIAVQGRFEPLRGSVVMNVMMYFGDNRKRDIDSYLKILLDSMEGIIYENDNQVVEMHCFKEIDVKNPRTVIQIL
jgi:Holliday junction resolvase RusA-like endonuclease